MRDWSVTRVSGGAQCPGHPGAGPGRRGRPRRGGRGRPPGSRPRRTTPRSRSQLRPRPARTATGRCRRAAAIKTREVSTPALTPAQQHAINGRITLADPAALRAHLKTLRAEAERRDHEAGVPEHCLGLGEPEPLGVADEAVGYNQGAVALDSYLGDGGAAFGACPAVPASPLRAAGRIKYRLLHRGGSKPRLGEVPARERRFDDHEEELADIISTDRDLVAAHQLRIVVPVRGTCNVYQVNFTAI